MAQKQGAKDAAGEAAALFELGKVYYDRQQDQQQAPFQHQCIGCVAVWQALPCAAEPVVLRGTAPDALPVKALAYTRAGPEVPPPRA